MPKRRLREHYLAIRKTEHDAWGPPQEQALENHLLSLPAFSAARTLLLYASMRGELPTLALLARLLAAGRRVALPIAHEEDKSISLSYLSSPHDLAPGLFDVPEPKEEKREACSPSKIDAALIPALAYDLHGHRLGMGLGYYDRFLPQLACPLIGLCYDAQLSSSPLPREAHDRPVDYVVTEKRVVICRPR
jgi:5-formyltetrahydrofolate cyclo-ligase